MTTLNARPAGTRRSAVLVLMSLALLFMVVFSASLLYQVWTKEPATSAVAVAAPAPEATPTPKPSPTVKKNPAAKPQPAVKRDDTVGASTAAVFFVVAGVVLFGSVRR